MKARIPAEACALVLADELARNGIRHACLAPGSRSAPLAIALVDHPDVTVSVSLDERSAGFLALGIAKATGVPAVVVCTSGTATANLYPAVEEAHHGRIPLLVLTADRPPELRATGANQTIDQLKLYGDSVRWFCDLGVPDGQLDASPNSYWRSVVCQALARATGSPPGPVHVNVALREPLVAEEGAAPLDLDLYGRDGGSPWLVTERSSAVPDDSLVERLAAELSAIERGVVVVGAGDFDAAPFEDLAAALGWPLLADPLSNVRRFTGTISTYDALLRAPWGDANRPEIVVRTGALGISKALVAWLAAVPRQILIDPDATFVDPMRTTSDLVVADPNQLFATLAPLIERPATPWLRSWQEADEIALHALEAALGEERELSEPAVAHHLVDALPDGASLVVGASMPFRDIEWFTRPSAVRFFGNRGVNGIDGFVSTALGVAVGTGAPMWALCGDLTLLHDSNGFLGTPAVDCTFVVVNNDGGGIFSFLPQADHPEHFEALFGTPHGRDLAKLADFHRLEHRLVGSAAELRAALPGVGIRIIEVRTDRAANVEVHRALNAKVAEALADPRHH